MGTGEALLEQVTHNSVRRGFDFMIVAVLNEMMLVHQLA